MSSFIGDQQFGLSITPSNFNIIKNGAASLSIPSGQQEINVNSNKITNLLDPTLAQDASSKNYVDTRTINTLASQTADYSFNSFKLTNLANATLATDALNRQTGDGRYYLNTTTLNNIVAPAGSVSLNSQKITNLANATLITDAVPYGQSPKCEFIQLSATTIPAINTLFTNTQWTAPQASNLISSISYNNGQITLGVGVYKIMINGIMTSTTNTNFISLGLTDQTQAYIFTNPVQQQCRLMTSGSNNTQCSNNPLTVLLQVTSGTRIIALTNKAQSGTLTGLGIQFIVQQI